MGPGGGSGRELTGGGPRERRGAALRGLWGEKGGAVTRRAAWAGGARSVVPGAGRGPEVGAD